MAAPANVWLGHRVPLVGCHHARGRASFFKRVLQSQGIDDGRQHPHVIRRDAFHVLRRRSHASEKVSAADHQSDLNSGVGHLGDFLSQRRNPRRIDTERALAGQDLAAQLQKNATVAGHGGLLGRGLFGLRVRLCAVADLEADKARYRDILAELGDLGLDHIRDRRGVFLDERLLV